MASAHRRSVRCETPWTAWPAGSRVVVRSRLPDGRYSDALGELIEATPTGVIVRTKRGDVEVPAALIAIAKLVAPRPP
ncbi:MAG: hypothetical protein LBK59_06270 [Bifidobacteriaceae bacterium]|jgi:hypothetical protein|nr:hypothetical protein [Bifidobacteriaceae bacterium]